MKRLLSLSGFLTGMSLLFLVSGAQAVTWDISAPLYSSPAGFYSVPTSQNGAYWTYSSTYFNFNNYGAGAVSNSSDLNTLNVPAVDDTIEDFGSNPGSITFSAIAGGGVLSDGLFSAGSAVITHSGLTAMNGVSTGLQHIVSDTYRNFLPDGNGTITVTAGFSGAIAWDVYNYSWNDPMFPGPINWDDPYSGFRLQGNVTITAHDAMANVQVGDAHVLNFNNDIVSGSLQIDPIANPNIYYVMHVSLVIDTELQNANPSYGAFYNNAGPIPVPLQIGTALDPFELTAVVSQNQVPIPPTLVLLLSGVGGLVAIRRRVTGA